MDGDPLDGATVGILGGTGALGRGLARRLAASGLPVVLGSRDAGRARRLADDLTAATGGDVRGATNAHAARLGDPVIVAVPWSAHAAVLAALREELAGSVVVDCVNPLAFDEHGPRAVSVEEGSAAQQAASLLPASMVTAAFHHVPAAGLDDRSAMAPADVLVLGDDTEAVDATIALVERTPGLRGIPAGGLVHAGPVEGLTAALIAVNRRFGVHAGVRLTGL